MSAAINAAMVAGHGLPVRETMAGVAHQEVRCPCCGTWRPAFCVTKLEGQMAADIGSEWACDAEVSQWIRNNSASQQGGNQ